MLRIKGKAAGSLLPLLELYRSMPLGAGGNLSLIRLRKVSQTEGFFLRRSRDGGDDLNPHLLGLLTVFVAAVEGIRQNLFRRISTLFSRFRGGDQGVGVADMRRFRLHKAGEIR